MILVPDNDGRIPFFGMVSNDRLDPGHAGTCGVDQPETGCLDSGALVGWYAMGPDHDGAAFQPGDILDGYHPLRFEQVHHLGVMYQRTEGINGPFFTVRLCQDLLHGATDAHTKPGRSCKNHFQCPASFKIEK